MSMMHAKFSKVRMLRISAKQLNEDFGNIFNWLVDNKLSIHFDEDKAKSLLLISNKMKKVPMLQIIYGNIQIHESLTWVI